MRWMYECFRFDLSMVSKTDALIYAQYHEWHNSVMSVCTLTSHFIRYTYLISTLVFHFISYSDQIDAL